MKRVPAGPAFLPPASALLLIFLQLSVLTSASTEGSLTLQTYRQSPPRFHRVLREALLNGEEVEPAIRSVTETAGDYSFSGLLAPAQQLRNLLLLEHAAWKDWDLGRHEQALSLYRKTAERLEAIGATSEAVFCLYYMAEILAELERYAESARYQELAFQKLAGQECFYLEALLYQSRGYTAWFMDHLPASVVAFGRALERWRHFEFSDSILSTWNNLAALYEELELFGKAEDCYRKALLEVDKSTPPEMNFPLLLNFALFLQRTGKPEEARRMLSAADHLKSVAGPQLELARAEILQDRQALEHLQSSRPSLRIEKMLLQAKWERDKNHLKEAQTLLEKAAQESRLHGLQLQTRKVSLELGKLLELQGRLKEAAQLYSRSLEREELLHRAESVFPYTRAVSPFLDGSIRCLVALGRVNQARRLIHRWVALRRQRARSLLASSTPLNTGVGELQLLVEAARLDSLIPADLKEESPDKAADRLSDSRNFTLLEFWPEKDRILVWMDGPRASSFHQLPQPALFQEFVVELLEPLYNPSRRLSPGPPKSKLQQLYQVLFAELEGELESSRLLVIPHKFLQALPFELLMDHEGNYLLERFAFSYLPHPLAVTAPPLNRGAEGILLSPASFVASGRPGASKERLVLPMLFPHLEVRESWNENELLQADWIHVSTHFRLDQQFWLGSGLSIGAAEVPALRMLGKPLACNVLSLGMCDGGNNFSAVSPYWLGLAELFLSGGVRSLVVSRWQMDELSADIYLEFYRLCRQGMEMDEALTTARRRFIKRILERGGNRISADHPFFWAGISYIGPPGNRLSLRVAANRMEWFAGAALFLILTLIVVRLFRQLEKGFPV